MDLAGGIAGYPCAASCFSPNNIYTKLSKILDINFIRNSFL
jgi:hypothetical protein